MTADNAWRKLFDRYAMFNFYKEIFLPSSFFGGRVTRGQLLNGLCAVAVLLMCIVIAWQPLFSTAPKATYTLGGIALSLTFFLISAMLVIYVTLLTISLVIRRLHDIDASGKWAFYFLFPPITVPGLIYLLLISSSGPNKYSHVTVAQVHKFCTRCGKRNLEAAKFCKHCGHGF